MACDDCRAAVTAVVVCMQSIIGACDSVSKSTTEVSIPSKEEKHTQLPAVVEVLKQQQNNDDTKIIYKRVREKGFG